MNRRTLIATAMTGLVAMGATAASVSVSAAGQEKCYGVAAAGKNDCATKTNSCAGTVESARQGGAFVAVPEGTCEKLAGGSLEPK